MKLQWLKRSCSVLLAAAMTYFSIGMPVTAEEEPTLEEPQEQFELETTEAGAVEEPNVDVTEGSLLQAAMEAGYMKNAQFVLEFSSKKASNIPIDLSNAEVSYYDVDGNESIDITDAICFLTMYARKAMGLDPVPSEGWPLTPPNQGESDIPQTTEATTTTETTTTTTETTTEAITTTTETTTVPMTTTTSQITTTLPTTLQTTTTVAAITMTTKATTTYQTTTTQSGTTTATAKATTTTAKTTAKPAVTTTVITYATKPGIGAGAIFEGVDVSVYQGNIDWNKAKADGIEFAIMRAGYGKYVSQKDKYFDQNMKNAKAAGLPCGVYWFSYALTPEDAIKEADACYEVIKNYKLEYPVSFDMETESQMKLPKETVAQIIEAFCGRMESYGYYTTLYTYASFLNYKVEDRIFDKYDIWVAHYNTSKPAFNRNYGLWQYSCTGSVWGITGNVDRDYVYLDYERIIKNAHLNGF